jgi:two-component system cell cycle response regulator DivK
MVRSYPMGRAIDPSATDDGEILDAPAVRAPRDLHHLLTSAVEHEQRVERLLRSVEERAADACPAGDLLWAVREVAASARAHRARAETLAARSFSAPSAAPAGQRRQILIVDDSRDGRDSVALILEAAGFRVITANDGLEAIVAAHEHHPALILMDLEMPVLGGIQATYLLRASPATRHLKIVAHTGRVDTNDFVSMFDAVLMKPSAPNALVALIQLLAGPPVTEPASDGSRPTP